MNEVVGVEAVGVLVSWGECGALVISVCVWFISVFYLRWLVGIRDLFRYPRLLVLSVKAFRISPGCLTWSITL